MNDESEELDPIADDDRATAHARSRRTWSRGASIAGGVGAIVILPLVGLWVQRAPIAENLIDRELAARDVAMRYRVAAIGPRTQRIENVVLGDPANPDLTARWVEVDIALGGLSPSVTAVRAGGVRLRGSYRDGKLALGELDKFLGGGDSVDSSLPDIALALSDARAAFMTDYGAVGVEVAGSGNLRDGFAARVVAASPVLGSGNCEVRSVVADWRVAVSTGAPRITGPIRSGRIQCAENIALTNPVATVNVGLPSDLDGASGSATLGAGMANAAGIAFARPEGQVSFAIGDGELSGKALLQTDAISGLGVASGEGMARISFRRAKNSGALAAETQLTLADVRAAKGNPLAEAGARLAGTPLQPLAAKLTRAVDRAGRANRLVVGGRAESAAGKTRLQIDRATFDSLSGARVVLDSGARATIDPSQGTWAVDGSMSMRGGDLPVATLRLLERSAGGVEGVLTMQPYEAPGARLTFKPLRFQTTATGALAARTVASISGPLPDGVLRDVTMPVDLRMSGDGDLRLNPDCVPARWSEVRLSSFRVVNGGATLCPRDGAMLRVADGRVGGGVEAVRVALNGQIGSSALALRAGGVGYDLASSAFSGQRVDVRIGSGPSPVILKADTLSGRAVSGRLGGRFAGGGARIGSVPFDMTELEGDWSYAGGALRLDGAMRVADTAPSARFNPLRADDVRLTLKDNRITASGRLRHPTRGDAFAAVTVSHVLSDGTGAADVRLTDLRFGDALQPDDLTPLALGVVANVDGRVEGDAAIRWGASGVTSSTGTFSTHDMNLAAAFGPVQNLATTVRFTDLLAIESAPGQVVTLGSVNPGIEVRDGRIRYQLLRDQKVRIEGGEWPFSGGTLSLLPETLDMGAERERRLTFRVVGLDAGAFINTLELENISATGTYDGLLPMVFDSNGGRIASGILVARQEGLPPLIVTDARTLTVPCDRTKQAGTLSYVGEVSNAEMNMFGKLAFDALKNLRYRCLTILLDGAIDGEFLTRIAINGVNQGSIEARQSALARPFLGLPFIFNVRIEAPFRGLLNTYQSFTDPSTLIRNSLGQQYQTVLDPRDDVQPVESETMPVRKGE